MIKDETFNEKKRKIVAIILMVCLIALVLVVTGDGKIRTKASDTSVSETSHNFIRPLSYIDRQPVASRHTYLVNEAKTVTELVVNQGLFIAEYKKDFKNLQNYDYNIDARYKDFALDMNRYKEKIEDAISTIQSMRPDDDATIAHQQEMVEKLSRLRDSVREYRNHMRTPKDTINYLAQCQYELRRVSDSVLLP